MALSGINPTDWKIAAKNAGPQAGPFQIPNHDGAGTIESLAPGVDSLRVGQRVWLYLAARDRQWGTAAEYSVIPTERAVPLPDSASFQRASRSASRR